MKDVGYAPRLEYSVTAGVDDIGSRPERTLSLVANDLDGCSVVTVKGVDAFGVRTNRDLPGLVSRVRKTLQEISTPPLDNVDREWWPYGFGLPGQMNAGDEQRIKAALRRLAALGWEFFDKIIPQDCREEIGRALEPERRIIHVAHVLLEKIIPWGVVYDRRYDPHKQVDDEGNPVAFEVCLSPLSRLDGTTPFQACGENPDCLLHPDCVRQRHDSGLPALLPETVVCPLHFWGFKHILEVPPQQVQAMATWAGRPIYRAGETRLSLAPRRAARPGRRPPAQPHCRRPRRQGLLSGGSFTWMPPSLAIFTLAPFRHAHRRVFAVADDVDHDGQDDGRAPGNPGADGHGHGQRLLLSLGPQEPFQKALIACWFSVAACGLTVTSASFSGMLPGRGRCRRRRTGVLPQEERLSSSGVSCRAASRASRRGTPPSESPEEDNLSSCGKAPGRGAEGDRGQEASGEACRGHGWRRKRQRKPASN